VALVVVTYVLPVWAARRAGLDPRDWSTGAWVDAGNAIGGRWLGAAIALGAVVGAFGAFNSLVMSYSRVPVALAEHGVLPKVLAKRDATTGAPRVAIAACAVTYAACLGLGFSRLLVLDVFLYGASLVLEFIALVMLRIREPDLPRRFRVPGGLAGAIAVGVVPTALLVVALVNSIRAGAAGPELVLGAVLLNLGPLIYWIRTRRTSVTTS
jgi:amino acid transporter